MIGRPPQALAERFEKHYQPIPWTGCWIWTGGLGGTGYGQIRDDPEHGSRSARASRISYRLHISEIPEGMLVLHKCDNPVCVNPDHLFLGTHLDNAKDRNAKGRQAHQRGEAQGNSKLTEEQVKAIRIDKRKGVQIAKEYGVCGATISMIRTGKRWTHSDNLI